MAAENLIKSENLQRVREVELTQMFHDSIRKLMEALGITRKIAKEAGTKLKIYKVAGVLQDGTVAEGETIPLSKYQTTWVDGPEITLNKWRKATTAEAIIDKGFDQACDDTDDAMLKDIQKGIRTDFFAFLATGTGSAVGKTLQAVLARVWGQLAVLFDDEAVDAAYFVNPLDVADYLADATVTMQTAFGMTYIKGFLGIYDLFLNSTVPQGKVFGTAKQNIILYYIAAGNSDLAKAFDFTTDETGFIGIHESSDYSNLTHDATMISGIKLLAEKIDGVVVGTIGDTEATAVSTMEETTPAYTEHTGETLNEMTVEHIKELAAERGYTIKATIKADIIAEFLTQQNGQ